MALEITEEVIRYVVELGQVDQDGEDMGPQGRKLVRKCVMYGEVCETKFEKWADMTLAEVITALQGL